MENSTACKFMISSLNFRGLFDLLTPSCRAPESGCMKRGYSLTVLTMLLLTNREVSKKVSPCEIINKTY